MSAVKEVNTCHLTLRFYFFQYFLQADSEIIAITRDYVVIFHL